MATENDTKRNSQENSYKFKPYDSAEFKKRLPALLANLQIQLDEMDEQDRYHYRVRNPNSHIDLG